MLLELGLGSCSATTAEALEVVHVTLEATAEAEEAASAGALTDAPAPEIRWRGVVQLLFLFLFPRASRWRRRGGDEAKDRDGRAQEAERD